MPRPLLTLLLLALTAISALAADTPEAVVTHQLEAMRAGDWDKFTSYMHGPALVEFQTNVLTMLNTATNDPARDQILKMFFNNKTVAEMTTASPGTFFGSVMNGLSLNNPALKQSMAGMDGQVIGHVDEGPDKTHVVTRITMPLGEGKVTKMEVTTLQREGDSWRALLKGDMQAVVAGFARMLQPK